MKYIKPLIILSVPIVIVIAVVLGIRPSGGGRTTAERSKAALKSLPYLDWQPAEKADIDKSGVTMHDQDRSYKGLNLYNYDGPPKGYLIDMSGLVLHTWSSPDGKWHHVELLDNGDLLAIVKNEELLKLGWESNTKWSSKGKYHHDLAIADNGDIYALRWGLLDVPLGSATIPIINDYLTILSADGVIKKEISIYDLFGSEITEEEREEIRQYLEDKESEGEKIEMEPQTIFDVFHTNTVEIIERDIEGLASEGDVLICVRNLNTVAIIDVSAEEVVWRLKRDDLDRPHQPSIVGENILVFDNGFERRYSRVIELNPYTGETVWDYTAQRKRSFFSSVRGACQRLPNGNTLITESNRAHVFEVTPEGKTVWEFYGSEVAKKAKKRRPIYRMTRLALNSLTPGLIRTEPAQTPEDTDPRRAGL